MNNNEVSEHVTSVKESAPKKRKIPFKIITTVLILALVAGIIIAYAKGYFFTESGVALKDISDEHAAESTDNVVPNNMEIPLNTLPAPRTDDGSGEEPAFYNNDEWPDGEVLASDLPEDNHLNSRVTFIQFGRYPKNNGGTPEPIEWQMLENDGKTVLLFARYGLDCKPFHNEKANTNWRDCDLRKWLNSDKSDGFLGHAFNADEQSRIIDSVINTNFNTIVDSSITRGCGETCDKVFCLSIDEAYQYFGGSKENLGCKDRWDYDGSGYNYIWINYKRACLPTAYARLNGAITIFSSSELREEYKMSSSASARWSNNCMFWLRSPCFFADHTAYVDFFGAVNTHGSLVCSADIAIRPALRIKLK
ncbi:MAG: DUF6273 domain-containing protein [bacterium]|nr:DUF6273 domain-containing protein [bacterium]